MKTRLFSRQLLSSALLSLLVISGQVVANTETPPNTEEPILLADNSAQDNNLIQNNNYPESNNYSESNGSSVFDPWEPFNRRIHGFNNVVDRSIARPVAKGYTKVVPAPVRKGVGNVFSNLGKPVVAVNLLLQGHPKQSVQTLGRFVINSTLGVAGIFDPATAAKLPLYQGDFGQTLGVWGWKKSRYLVLPFIGPRTIRDTGGLVADSSLSLVRQIESDKVRLGLQGVQLVNGRAQLLPLDNLREGVADDYAFVRDAWTQRRRLQIDQARGTSDDSLPDYLQEEYIHPTMPVDSIPIPAALPN